MIPQGKKAAQKTSGIWGVRPTFKFPGREPSLVADSVACSSAVALKGVTKDSAPTKNVGRP